MGQVFGFIKARLLEGLFILLPVVLVIFLLIKAVGLATRISAPLASHLAVREIWGAGAATVLAILCIIAACFIIGLIVRAGLGARLGRTVERTALARLPMYSMFKSMSQAFSGKHESDVFSVAAVRLYDSDVVALALITEEHDNGDFTVFIPVAPTPTVGLIYYLKPDRVRKLDVSMSHAMDSVMKWGVDSKAVFKGLAEKA
jgi:uncharacterized membrane protein